MYMGELLTAYIEYFLAFLHLKAQNNFFSQLTTHDIFFKPQLN